VNLEVKPSDLAFPKLADPEDRIWLFLAASGALIAMRFVAAAFLPLYYGDEPYYWLWSRHLAWGYYDHPPAVAVLIRAGTALFGDTEFGVRFAGLAMSVPMTLCVWRTGSLLLGGTENGGRAALFFNLTLQATIQTFMATPDAAALACSAAFIWALAEMTVSRNGRWWLLAGLFAGLGLLAKYTVLFTAAGAVVWLLLTKDGRAWLKTPWPWLGGTIAALLFAPNLIWNADNDWGTLAFQFGRIVSSDQQWWYLPQFVAEQFVLASPFIADLAIRGLWRTTRSKDQRHLLIAALLWPAIIFFSIHALQDRVHRNWPDIIYPALAVAAAYAFHNKLGPRFLRSGAVPVAVLILVAVYAQALFRVVPLERVDALNQHLASGMKDVTAPIARVVSLTGARGVVTTDFAMTAWLRFYLSSPVPVIQLTDEFRYPYAPRATASDLGGTLIYVAPDVNLEVLPLLQARFSTVEPVQDTLRGGDGVSAPAFYFYRLSGFHGEPAGRIP
jgi:4-amino-4-deoxy-L-arabinose transferase-like glycosyltransferase